MRAEPDACRPGAFNGAGAGSPRRRSTTTGAPTRPRLLLQRSRGWITPETTLQSPHARGGPRSFNGAGAGSPRRQAAHGILTPAIALQRSRGWITPETSPTRSRPRTRLAAFNGAGAGSPRRPYTRDRERRSRSSAFNGAGAGSPRRPRPGSAVIGRPFHPSTEPGLDHPGDAGCSLPMRSFVILQRSRGWITPETRWRSAIRPCGLSLQRSRGWITPETRFSEWANEAQSPSTEPGLDHPGDIAGANRDQATIAALQRSRGWITPETARPRTCTYAGLSRSISSAPKNRSPSHPARETAHGQ